MFVQELRFLSDQWPRLKGEAIGRRISLLSNGLPGFWLFSRNDPRCLIRSFSEKICGTVQTTRLLRPSLTKAARGGFVIFLGFAMMFTGNFVEYWFLTGLPHQGPAGIPRSIFWMTFLLGTIMMLISSIVIGFMMRKITVIPGWLKLAFLLVLPLTFVGEFICLKFVGMPVRVLSIFAGSYGLFLERSVDL